MKRSWLWRFKRAIKFWWQRRTRGWDDSETWNLDISLSALIIPRLQRFKQLKNAHPAELTMEQWDEVLDKMINAFSVYKKQFDYVDLDEEYVAFEKFKEAQEGLELFAKYFGNLWD